MPYTVGEAQPLTMQPGPGVPMPSVVPTMPGQQPRIQPVPMAPSGGNSSTGSLSCL